MLDWNLIVARDDKRAKVVAILIYEDEERETEFLRRALETFRG